MSCCVFFFAAKGNNSGSALKGESCLDGAVPYDSAEYSVFLGIVVR